MRSASSSRCSAARRSRGRSRRARRSGCGASACSWPWPRTNRKCKPALAAFLQGLQESGWAVGRNVRIDTRWSGGDAAALAQDMRRNWSRSPGRHPGRHRSDLRPLQQATRTVPIVFAQVLDPVGAGFVDSLARPGGNVTGFIQFEYGLSGKWLELLKEIAPQVKRVGGPAGSGDTSCRDRTVGRDPGCGAAAGRGVEPDRSARRRRIERAVDGFARAPNGGLIVAVGARRIFIAN